MTSRYLSGCIAILAAVSCASAGCDVPTDATPSAERAEPDLSQLAIEKIETNGKGCPKDDLNTVATVLSVDKQSFLIIYRDMELTIPPGPKVKNLNCQVAVEVHVPTGYQVALATVDTRGYLYLDANIEARVTSGYFFAGLPLGTYAHPTFVGPYDDYVQLSDDIPLESRVWSDCGTSAIFGINTSLYLNANDNPEGEAFFPPLVSDPELRRIVRWQIRAC